jgi:predicted DNA repair protein MutK
MIGGGYLAFEATEKIIEKLFHEHEHEDALMEAVSDPGELERLQVAGAIRTDFILSAEIMAISLASLGHLSLVTTAIALAAVALAITAGVYGAVALIVKLDDFGLHLAKRRSTGARAIGQALVRIVPKMLSGLSGIGTIAMLWVGGGILLHGLEEMHVADAIPGAFHDLAHWIAIRTGFLSGAVEWLLNAVESTLFALVVGGAITFVVRRFTKRPDQLIVD